MKKLAMICLLTCGCWLLAAPAPGAEKLKEQKVLKATVGSDGVQRVEILGGGYFFNPNHIIVKVNLPVELIVRKESGVIPHNIVMKVPEAGINFDVTMAEKPTTIRFTPTKAGVYPFYCSKKLLFFESHREKGMAGTLEVTE